ncbi:hypothetical protein [Pseudomonas sp. RL_105y_Pfl2_101]|uniref:hypothetical protein n=1 Tax=Pseudomonas sp. RL_105y_Pfl2_101 TaxID=3088708 RepID=UPI0030D8595F
MTVILCGLGGCLPPQIIDNQQISSGLDTTPEWIESRTGIRERRMVSDGLSMLDLAIKAGARALASAEGRAVQAVVVATTSPERICPAAAPEVASVLGLGDVRAHDPGRGGAAASRRFKPCCRGDRAQLPSLRPGVCR